MLAYCVRIRIFIQAAEFMEEAIMSFRSRFTAIRVSHSGGCASRTPGAGDRSGRFGESGYLEGFTCFDLGFGTYDKERVCRHHRLEPLLSPSAGQ